MLPRLQAEESFLTAERTVIGSGTLEPSVARATTRRWSQATGRAVARAAQASPAALGAIGIGVRHVPRKPATA
jgi:hypothetical protein